MVDIDARSTDRRNTVKLALKIDGMRCEACAEKVTSAIQGVRGVHLAAVSVATGSALVETTADVGFDEVRAAASVGGEYMVTEGNDSARDMAQATQSRESLFPLFLIVAFITGTTLAIAGATSAWEAETLMRHFMAGFFLVFSFFKFLDLKGFSGTYKTYNLLAKQIPGWAIAYPFVELGLGLAYIFSWLPTVTNSVTLGLMSVGAIGVLQALSKRQAIRCACLGTVLNLPMSKVTLTEDLVMAGMAGVMLLIY